MPRGASSTAVSRGAFVVAGFQGGGGGGHAALVGVRCRGCRLHTSGRLMGWESRRSAGRRGHENGRERVRVAVCEAPFNQAALPDDKFQSTRKHQTSIQTTRVFTDRFPASFWLKLTNRWPRQHSPQAYTPTLTGTNPFGEATIIHPDTLVSTVSNR